MRVLEHERAVTAWVETLAGPDTATLRLGGSWRLAIVLLLARPGHDATSSAYAASASAPAVVSRLAAT